MKQFLLTLSVVFLSVLVGACGAPKSYTRNPPGVTIGDPNLTGHFHRSAVIMMYMDHNETNRIPFDTVYVRPYEDHSLMEPRLRNLVPMTDWPYIMEAYNFYLGVYLHHLHLDYGVPYSNAEHIWHQTGRHREFFQKRQDMTRLVDAITHNPTTPPRSYGRRPFAFAQREFKSGSELIAIALSRTCPETTDEILLQYCGENYGPLLLSDLKNLIEMARRVRPNYTGDEWDQFVAKMDHLRKASQYPFYTTNSAKKPEYYRDGGRR